MRLKLLAIAGVAAAVIIGAALSITSDATAASEGQGAPQMPPTEVYVVTLKEETAVFTKDLPGRTSAVRVAEIRPQVSGIIQKRFFTEGSDVKKGQQLYQIDPAPFEVALQSAQAELLRAESNLLSTGPRAERYKELVESGGVSRQEFDDAITAFAQSQAAVETARINLNYTKVLAPISGFIGKSSVTEGALVTSGQPNALARIQQLDTIYVDVSQSAPEVMALRRNSDGQKATAEVELLLDGTNTVYPHKGQMQFSEMMVDETTGTVQLRVLFPNPDKEILPGLFVKARIVQAKQEGALLAPQQGIARSANGSTIAWVVDENGIVNPRPVKVTTAIGDKWLVTEGLKAGDKIVVEGLQKIGPGAKVNPVEKPSASN
jgi:membrane fusion protein (multidrug efflux system)